MLIHIRDISGMFCDFWEKSNGLNFEEKRLMWKDFHELPNKDIFSYLESIKNYSIDELEECFKKYAIHYDKITIFSDIIKNNINEICKSCSNIFNINNLELNFVIMVGQYHADAFATTLFNETTAFYFLEKMPELKYLDIVLGHEITHLFQFSQFIKEEHETTMAENIFMEGLASFASSIICPGFSKAEYLYFNSQSNQWLLDCKKYLPRLKSEIIDNIENTEDFYCKKYFSESNEYTSGIPKRIGYLLGYDIIAYLNKYYSLDELIRWNSDKAKVEVRNAILNIV